VSVGHDHELCQNGQTNRGAGVWTHRGPSNCVLSGDLEPATKKDTFWGHTCTRQDLPTVDILDVVREGAGAMWLVATILLQRHVIITCRGHASGAGQTQPSAIDRSSPADWRMTCRWKYDEQVTGGCSRGLTVSSSSANYITTHTSHLHHTEQVPP